MKKYLTLLLLLLSLVGCSVDTGKDAINDNLIEVNDLGTDLNTTQSTSDTIANTKSIYYKNDFLNDNNLSVTQDNVAIFKINNNVALDEGIPFVVEFEDDYEFCIDGAQNILRVEIFDATNTSVSYAKPEFSLNCKTIHLTPQKYTVKLSYINKIISMYDAYVPYVRLFEKREIESDLTPTEWENGKLYESTIGNEKYSRFMGFRYCYKTPINDNSFLSFWKDLNKFTLSLRVNMDDGTIFKCTYPGTDLPVIGISNASDIGDIDSIVANLLSTQNKPSIIYSRPSASSNLVDLDTEINIKFRGVVDRLLLEDAFVITPNVNGILSLNGQILTFSPDNKLDYLTTYRVQLKGLSDSGIPIENIDFSFITHDKYTFDDSKSTLDDYELCAVGVSASCVSEYFSVIQSISASLPNDIVNGSRTLEIKTELDKVTASNILMDYKLVDETNSPIINGTLLLPTGVKTFTNEITFDIFRFLDVERNATLIISNIRNAYVNENNYFNYVVKAGEFFNSHSETLEPEVVEINNLYFTNDTAKNKILTIELNSIAVEDVDVSIYFDATNKKIKSCKEFPIVSETSPCSTNLYEPGWQITTIKKGTNSVDMNVTFSTNEDAYVYSEDFEATVFAARNASVEVSLSASVSFVIE